MALPPGGIPNPSDGDRKRLMQRADSFAIGTGTREQKDRDELAEFDETMEGIINKTKQAESTQQTENQEQALEEHREEKAQLEAERRGSSSPSHQPFLGLSVLPGITNPNLTVGHAAEAHSQRRTENVVGESEAVVESVSPEVLQGLKAAGLERPVVTLDDPRLAGACEDLQKDFIMSLRGSDRVYVWNRQTCHQVVRIGLRESSLESAAGTVVETVTRRGRVDEKTRRERDLPGEDFQPS